jgi:hypothetical protein
LLAMSGETRTGIVSLFWASKCHEVTSSPFCLCASHNPRGPIAEYEALMEKVKQGRHVYFANSTGAR